MSYSELFKKISSVVVHILAVRSKEEWRSLGTGFIAQNLLVTNEHVIKNLPPDICILIRFYNSSKDNILDGEQFTYSDFKNSQIGGSPTQGYDYAIFKLPKLQNRELYSFDFDEPSKKLIGEQVCFLGYPLNRLNLIFHIGFISSLTKIGVADVIMIDGSVNNGNSGGPLINPETGNVIGIITRKLTGLNETFEQLRLVLQENVKILSNSGVVISVSDVDVMEYFKINQKHILELTNQIERSANVGIGFAFSTEQLQQDLAFSS